MPQRARDAAIHLAGQPLDADGMQTHLLADLRAAFCRADTDRLTSAELIESLTADPTSIWNSYLKDKAITQPLLARMLRRFDVVPVTIKDGDDRGKGYKRGADDKRRGEQSISALEDAFDRYLPPCAGVTCDKPISTGDVTPNADVTCKRCHVCKLRDMQAVEPDVTCHGAKPPKETETQESADDDVAETF